ncbi:hypothetical protein THAOC_03364 [Thalassiosira oceanica]|uniref:Uncharacterized protein n=1 Tax=Thalassiosira oceanica TaxID=159749 RepID=K0T7Y5_THAOC|nr:hypothetical protein THAOC_03364 [Thalassiosira oceanica]|eukprot:EJK74928.1 hypothetical protein THAOC_03364 [Thalassiosira oceanica]
MRGRQEDTPMSCRGQKADGDPTRGIAPQAPVPVQGQTAGQPRTPSGHLPPPPPSSTLSPPAPPPAPTGNVTSPDTSLVTPTQHPFHANISSRNIPTYSYRALERTIDLYCAFKRTIGLSMKMTLLWLIPGWDIAADPSLGLLRQIGVAGLVGIGATVAE